MAAICAIVWLFDLPAAVVRAKGIVRFVETELLQHRHRDAEGEERTRRRGVLQELHERIERDRRLEADGSRDDTERARHHQHGEIAGPTPNTGDARPDSFLIEIVEVREHVVYVGAVADPSRSTFV